MNSHRTIIIFFTACLIAGLALGVGFAKMNAGAKLISLIPTRDDVQSAASSTQPEHSLSQVPDTENEPSAEEPPASPSTTQSPLPDNSAPVISATPTASVPTKKQASACPQPEDPKQTDLWLEPVSKDLSIGDYIPTHLVRLNNYVWTSKPTICLNASAALHLQSMFAAMHALKLHPVVSSGYRDAAYQATLKDQSDKANPDALYPSVALSGHSEHQLGLAFDLAAGPTYLLDDFKKSPEYAWLSQHAWEYGFIQSYPEGKEAITGYIAEPWHYRYVGLEHAKNIHDQGITTFEYLTNLKAETEKLQQGGMTSN